MIPQPIPQIIKHAVLHPYAWPGGYPLYAITSDGAALCCACLKSEWRHIAHAIRHQLSDGWRVEAIDINWEDENLSCENCNKNIESAYGESLSEK